MARVHILHTCVLSLLPLSDHFELRWSLGVSTDGVASLAAHAWLRKARSAARRFMRASLRSDALPAVPLPGAPDGRLLNAAR